MNRIKMNKTPGGRVTKDTKEMESLATDFNKQLNIVDLTIRPLQIVSRYEPLVSLEMNNELCKEFTDE
jgi:NifB/MoaA-like Fe-S oxidoreductase